MNWIAVTSAAILFAVGCGTSGQPPISGHDNDSTETPASSLWVAYCGLATSDGGPAGIVEHHLWDTEYKSHWKTGNHDDLEDRCFMVDAVDLKLAQIVKQMLPQFPQDFDAEWWREHIVEAKRESLADYIVLCDDVKHERQLVESGAAAEAWQLYRARFDNIKHAWDSKTGPAFTSGNHFVDFVANVSRRTGTDFSYVLEDVKP